VSPTNLFGRYIPHEHLASPYAPFDHASQNIFIACPSRDSALTSFAQLGAIRLKTERALVSLFDRTHQHVVAEATPTLSLVGGRVEDNVEQLRLGCCVFPKDRGFCHHVEGLQHIEDSVDVEDSAVVVTDTTNNEGFKSSALLSAFTDVCFYAAVPIVSPRGFTIGSFSVMDSKPKTLGLDHNALQFMKEMATTIMNHLAMRHLTQKSRQAERMIVGLGSFVEGRSTLRDSWREANAQYTASMKSGESTEGQLDIQQQRIQAIKQEKDEQELVFRDASAGAEDGSCRPINSIRPPIASRPSSASHQSNLNQQGETGSQSPRLESTQTGKSVRSVLAGESLEDNTLATNIKLIFSRAANLLRESIGAEGVLFLDANTERFGSLVDRNSRIVSGAGSKDSTSSGDESADSRSSLRHNPGAGQDLPEPDNTLVSECLGFSSSRVSSINDEPRAGQAIAIPQPLFNSILRRYPYGKIFTYNASGSVSEDSENSPRNVPSSPPSPSPEGLDGTNQQRPASRKRRKPMFQHDADNLIKIFVGARNILFLPLWDSDRSRWFAGTIVWTNDPEHVFTADNELVYITAFANSIMAEVRRLDVEMADKAKTNLVSSITHELRNPLHGILGTADILGDTAMNVLQHGMVHTIESCGRTLLDTINNLLDLTFIEKYQKKGASKSGMLPDKAPDLPVSPAEGGKMQIKEGGRKSSNTHVKLDVILEEVTECVFAGYSFYTHPEAPPPALSNSSSRWADPTTARQQVGSHDSQVTIIFDIQPDTEWDFYTHAGAWRRILMNVFGNALKYTPSGYIYVGLKSSETSSRPDGEYSRGQGDEFEVTLTVEDTGKGIGPDYLQNNLFTPFKQENPLAPGSGLGLSIVRQAVGFLGGSIEIESTVGVGTKLLIRTPLTRSSGASDTSSTGTLFSSQQRHTQGKTIGFLGFGSSLSSQRDTSLYSSLERLCREWFGLEVTNISSLEGKSNPFDFYLAVQTELDSEDVEGRNLFGLGPHLANRAGGSSPVVVICHSPEEAHRMFVAAKNQGEMSLFEFISQPCGPRKLARALDMCIKRQSDQSSGQPNNDEPTRWVEMPESTHLPVDIDASDAPRNRMKISKRPTADTMGSLERPSQLSSPEEIQNGNSHDATQPSPITDQLETETDSSRPFVLLVDDNELNLQLLCAYTKKEKTNYMTAQNGAEAVDLYKTNPGKFRVVIIGMFKHSLFLLLYASVCSNNLRYIDADYGWFRSVTANPPRREGTPRRHNEVGRANDIPHSNRRLDWA
jgi:signal transduction histidine kinase/GAF domain-containing protein